MAADKCAGCTNKYGFFERPSVCPECHRSFCQSCLPYKGKKVKKSQLQVSLEPCVYCKRQKAINKAQEAEILTNFQERYYDRAHIEAPIQSKLRLDMVMGQSSSPSQQRKEGGVQLSKEDKALEERLKRLKESNKKVNPPSYTDDEMREKLEKLRDEGGGHGDGGEGDGGADNSGGGGGSSQSGEEKTNYNTQTEQADRLMEQASDEVRIGQRVEEAMDEDLLRRFQQLKGTKNTSTSAPKGRPKVELDIQNLLEDMEVPAVPDEDPENLLQDLQAFLSREEAAAMNELNSSGVQNLIKEAQKLAAEEREGVTSDDPLADIVYPKLPEHQDEVPMVTGDREYSRSNPDVVKMLEEGRIELRLEEDQEEENSKFMQQASNRLGQLRGAEDHMTAHDISDDEVVKSKPKSTAGPRMDFTWSHFGAEPSITVPSSVNSSAARQLGILDDRDFPGNENGGEFDQEVQGLIARMLEETELDSKLEASGLNCDPEPSKSTSEPSDGGGASAGATALPPPPHASTGGGATRMGGGGGACGVDELPWCCICNDDATIRCYDCDNDLYCQRCFSEGHQQFGLYDHQYAPFEPPRK